ncbi:MAG: integration host factor subunit alpha [Deltaproteobacteria bacterium]|nr:integration host factor subunit alpha [Deltaproteobacteria bacterium]
MTVTKDHIITSMCRQLDMPKKKAVELLQTLLELIAKTLGKEEDVLISGFGKFCVRRKNARKGRNPATGEDLMLGSRQVVTFKCSPILRSKINKKKQ